MSGMRWHWICPGHATDPARPKNLFGALREMQSEGTDSGGDLRRRRALSHNASCWILSISDEWPDCRGREAPPVRWRNVQAVGRRADHTALSEPGVALHRVA